MVASHPRDDVQRAFVVLVYFFTTIFAFGIGHGLAANKSPELLVFLAVITTALFVVASASLGEVGA